MSSIVYLQRIVIPAALDLLPAEMDSPLAEAEMIAIALQESRGISRRQLGNGPARGFWQFEKGGVIGVMTHAKTKQTILSTLSQMSYPADVDVVQTALADNDLLAAVFARLLLWTHASPLPTTAAEGWDYYVSLWRPGKPHRATWDPFWVEANNVVKA
jgi:hypothetical protein